MDAVKSLFKASAFLFVLSCGCCGVFAGAWDTAHVFDDPSQTVRRVVVTGNFVKPRLIAELARKETKTPYLLFPAPGDTRIFFCPGGKGPALEIREADLPRFIEYIKPKQIVILGDSRFVPLSYVNAMGTGLNVLAIDSDNWYTNATTLGNLLGYRSLPEKYNADITKIDSGKWDGERKASNQAAPQAAQPLQQEAVPQQTQPPLPAERSSEQMTLMPPSQGQDEPVLLLPSKNTSTK